MATLFISYRRDDTQYQADRLNTELARYIPEPDKNIFIDIHDIPLGVNFAHHLDSTVAECDTLLALIGPKWLNASDPAGNRRLDDRDDFVRVEIASALKRGIPVIPVLFDDTAVPQADQLPPDLQELALRNGVTIRRGSFEHDVRTLVERLGIDPDTAQARAPKPKRKSGAGRWIGGVMLAGLLAAGGFYGAMSMGLLPALTQTMTDAPSTQETRTRTLGLTVRQNGQAVPFVFTPAADNSAPISTLRLQRGALSITLPARDLSAFEEYEPVISLVASDNGELFDLIEVGATRQEESMFSGACRGARYRFGSPEIWAPDFSMLFMGHPCGYIAYTPEQFTLSDATGHTFEISKISPPDDDSGNLIDTAAAIYIVVFMPDEYAPQADGPEVIYFSEIEYLKLEFE